MSRTLKFHLIVLKLVFREIISKKSFIITTVNLWQMFLNYWKTIGFVIKRNAIKKRR